MWNKALLALLGAGALSVASAHIATERYIPIGESPGVSGEHSYIGTIQGTSPTTRSMTMTSEKGTYEVRMDSNTRIYVDRSKERKENLRGTYEDCEAGRRVEVKFHDNDPSKPAEWIKVEGY